MKVALDATPLLGPRTGVGHYVAGLAEGLAELPGPEPEEVALVPFTWRGTGDLPRVAPAGPRLRLGRRRVPARLLQAAWARMAFPPVEWLAGRVDVFHATNFVAPPARRAAVVVTVHDLTYLRYPGMVTAASARYRDLVPRALRRGAIVCTPTAAVADEVADAYRLPPERLVVTSLGVGPAWRAATPPDPAWLAGRGLPERYLLFVGNREPRKNLPTLLTAYRDLLASRVPGGIAGSPGDLPPLVLVGPPGWGEALDLAGLPPEAVRTPGYLPEDDLARVVAGAAALACPSWYEGFGLPALEALACGTPVVAADLPALREVLGDQAELVPPGDATALADAVARVLDDPGGEPARAARRARAAAFTWAACARATLSAYHRALAATR
ncbi:MAG TPA: glycosyltransferase family 1 protein [Actinomycetes bacterium]|nr:glycosyltransferase family 1 protein [Actinomycetes bacterium]